MILYFIYLSGKFLLKSLRETNKRCMVFKDLNVGQVFVCNIGLKHSRNNRSGGFKSCIIFIHVETCSNKYRNCFNWTNIEWKVHVRPKKKKKKKKSVLMKSFSCTFAVLLFFRCLKVGSFVILLCCCFYDEVDLQHFDAAAVLLECFINKAELRNRLHKLFHL